MYAEGADDRSGDGTHQPPLLELQPGGVGDVGERDLGADVERVRQRLLAPRLLGVELARLVAHGGELLEVAGDHAAERDPALVQLLDGGGAGHEAQVAAVRQLVERAQPPLELGAPLVGLLLQRARPPLEILDLRLGGHAIGVDRLGRPPGERHAATARPATGDRKTRLVLSPAPVAFCHTLT